MGAERPRGPTPLLGRLHLRPLTWILLLIFLLVLALAMAPHVTALRSTEFQAMAVGFAVLVLLAGLWAIRQTVKRLEGLAAVARAIESGDYSVRGRDRGSDSIAALSRAIDGIAERTERTLAELTAREEELRRLAYYDPQTGLPNRKLVVELLAKEIAHARRSNELVGIAVFDLDNFKNVNDSFGDATGDKVLKAVAERIASSLREEDTAGRSGGDEFSVILPKAARTEDALAAARRLLAALETPIEADGQEIFVSASVGICSFPEDGDEPERLLSQATEALRLAKERGRNNLQVFHPERNREARERLELEQDLRRALLEGQLLVHFQPQISLLDGSLVGAEGLVRWQHPERGLLSAGLFIPLAEQSGLMPALGSWLLGEICRQCSEWQRSGLAPSPVSVNVSVRQFEAGDVAGSVRSALDAHGLGAEHLHLEITESLAMRDIEKVGESLARLREMGIKIHLDDFGTGYSSLSYVLKYPVDVLKIDRSFISGMAESEHSAAIVRMAIALAKNLGLRVIAEGVERPSELEFLRKLGCEAAQGFLFARPLPVEDYEALLRRGSVELPG